MKAENDNELGNAFATLNNLRVGTLLIGNDPSLTAAANGWPSWLFANLCRRSTNTADLSKPAAC